MTLTASVLDSITNTESLLCGLDGGYVVTQSGNGLPTGTITLRTVADLATSVDTYALSNTFPDESCSNNAGNGYILTSAGAPGSTTTRTLRSITQAAGALSVTGVGSFTMATSATALDGSFLDPGDTQVLVQYVGTDDLSAVNTSTGALDWTATLTGHSGVPDACLGNDRFIFRCATHGNYELWDGATPTLLDSIAQDGDAVDDASFFPVTSTSCLYALVTTGSDPMVVRVGLLSTAGDAFAWTWGPTDKVTAWTPANGWGVTLSAWGTVGAIGPQREVYSGGYLSMPLYIVNTATAAISATASDTSVGRGVYNGEMCWAGADTFATHDYDTYSVLVSWSVQDATPTYLRQRQSPVRAPSRVSPVQLRNRQTTMIR